MVGTCRDYTADTPRMFYQNFAISSPHVPLSTLRCKGSYLDIQFLDYQQYIIPDISGVISSEMMN